MIRMYLNTVILGLSVIIGVSLSVPAAITEYTNGSHFDFLLFLGMSVFLGYFLFASLVILFGFFTEGDEESRYKSLGAALSFIAYLLYYNSNPDFAYPQTLKEWHWTVLRFSFFTLLGSLFVGVILKEIKEKITGLLTK